MSARRSPSARALAVLTLRDIERTRGFSNRILSERLERTPTLDPRDRGLVTTLVYGVLRHRGRLDHHIDRAARQPRKIKGVLRDILRVACLELLELARARRVAASEACKTASALQAGGNLRGLITAIVSAVEREGAAVDEALALAAPSPAAALAGRWSIPSWLATRWVESLGAEGALARARALARPPSVDLRVDRHRTTSDAATAALAEEIPGATIAPVDTVPGCLRVRGGGDLFYGPLHEQGLVSVMALGSQRAVALLAPAPGARVLDACAGHGGKSAHLAEHMQRRGTLVLLEPHTARFEAQADTIARCALDTPELSLERHATTLEAFAASTPSQFDAILVDAPCTGLGDLARHPELRWTRGPEDLTRNTALQRGLLDAAARLLAPGGQLVWSVCSLEPEEGPALVEALGPECGLRLEATCTTTPEDDDADGFYAARLRRLDTAG